MKQQAVRGKDELQRTMLKILQQLTVNSDQLKIETQPKKIVSEFSHTDFGEVEIKDIPRVKKLASTYLVNSWTTIPHVTNHDEADITEMEDFRASLTDMYTGEKKKLLHQHLL